MVAHCATERVGIQNAVRHRHFELRNVGRPYEIVADLEQSSNALKFTQSGTSRLATRIRDEGEAVVVDIIVEHSGTSIEAKVLASLFSPFRQGDFSMARVYGGSGLGLIIPRNLAQLMGGSLNLTSVRGKSTQAILVIQMKKATLEDRLQVDEDSSMVHDCYPAGFRSTSHDALRALQTSNSAPMARPNVIRKVQTSTAVPGHHFSIHSDSPSSSTNHATALSREILKNSPFSPRGQRIKSTHCHKTAEKLGFATRSASNGQEALDYLAKPENNVDVVLMNCQVPVMDGYEATRRLRNGEAGRSPLRYGHSRSEKATPPVAAAEEEGVDDG